MSDSERSRPIPPMYTELKDLCLTTELAAQGRSNVTLIAPAGGAYDKQASRIQEAIEGLSGVRVPIAADDSLAGAIPIAGNLIVLGNRSTCRTVEELYNRHYTLLDLRYPGPKGSVVRSLHNPFGDGRNVLFVGGSDAAGVSAATEAFVEKLSEADAGGGTLSVGRLMEIELGEGVRVPRDVRDVEIWEASVGSGSRGYFGWNSISKRMAMYYMTGDAFHAREAIRLAFPDERAKEEITEVDGELIENKDEPLSGPYHYGAYMMILYWDLIEESPVFTDEERLRVTNAFSKQFAHPQEQGWRRQIAENFREGRMDAYAEPAPYVGSRHGQWSAIALYCLGRYFQRGYPDAFWQHCIEAAVWHFSSLHHHTWVTGELDQLSWYSTATAPVLTYMLLTGDREPIENGVLATLLRGQEILASGRDGDSTLTSASFGYLHKAAYLTQDGRWLEYLRRAGGDLDVFRLGRSYWPEGHLRPAPPADLVSKWSIHTLPEPMWRARASGLPLEDSFQFGSFRSAADASGDFTLIKGMNGVYRNPYHTFAILDLRLDGQTVLDGFFNQVQTKSDGMVEPEAALDAALRYRDVVGGTAVAVGETPNAAFCNWRRTLVQRVGRYALVVDGMRFRGDHREMEVDVMWQRRGSRPAPRERGMIRIEGTETPFEIRLADPVETAVEEDRVRMTWRGAVADGEERHLFTLIAGDRGDSGAPACARLADNAAALGLPEPAVAAVGAYEGLAGELVVLAGDHLYGMGVTEAAAGAPLFASGVPVHVDWDFVSGKMEVVADREAQIRLSVVDASGLKMDGETVVPETGADGCACIGIAAGRHTISGAVPEAGALEKAAGRLEDLLGRGRDDRRSDLEAADVSSGSDLPALPASFTLDVGTGVADLVVAETAAGARVCAAAGEAVHVLTEAGDELLRLQTDGPAQVLHWWEEHALLLVGCEDEKVIAFDIETGDRKWVFLSKEDPAVFQAAKPYWFRSAPGHGGIHGLHTGVFLDGKSQAFVGSACTLEIVDENGELVKRTAVFWGPGTAFALVDGAEGSIDLLVARRPADTQAPTVLNSRDPDRKESRFRGVPAGHTSIEPWGCLVRKHIFYEDLDGDGEKEVISDINGTWNRVSVWAGDGTPLYNANFGPAKSETSITARSRDNMRDLDVADLDGDGRKEILVATFDGMVVALDCQCRKLWATRLPSVPTVMACAGGDGVSRVVVGCEDGTMAVLDRGGEVVYTDSVAGRPTCVARLGGGAVMGTDRGVVKAWMVAD